MSKWAEGTRVRIISNWKYSPSYVGELVGCEATIETNRPDLKELGIIVDGRYNPKSSTGAFWFAKECLEIIKECRGECKMKKVKDYGKNYKFAFVGKMNDLNQAEIVAYLGELHVNDIIVVDNHYSNGALSVRKVMKIDLPRPDVDIAGIDGDVMGVADCHQYYVEQERLAEMAKIKKQMKARAAKFQEEQFYRLIAQEDAEMAALLENFKGLEQLEDAE